MTLVGSLAASTNARMAAAEMPCASGVLRGSAREAFSAESEIHVQASNDMAISFSMVAERAHDICLFRRGKRVRLWLNFLRIYGLRSGHRPGNARPAQDEVEDVVRLRQRLRRAAQYQRLPRLPRPARRAARRQRGGAAAHRAHRPAAELPDSGSREV